MGAMACPKRPNQPFQQCLVVGIDISAVVVEVEEGMDGHPDRENNKVQRGLWLLVAMNNRYW